MEGLDESQKQAIAAAKEQALSTALEAFKKLDINGDGEVDRSEIMALARSGQGLPGGASSEEKINQFFETFDDNGDGKIQQQEWLDFFGNLFDSVISSGLEGAQ